MGLESKFKFNVGDKVNYFTIISKQDSINTYQCLCKCGNVVQLKGYRLKKQISCGCKLKERSRNFQGYKLLGKKYFTELQRRATKKGLDFDLTIEFIYNLLEQQNFICAISGLPITLAKSSRFDSSTASLDRKDSKKGYTKDNIQWVHKDINWLKQDFDEKYFIELCNHVSNYYNLNQKIINEHAIDFEDVLILPQKSNISSRKQVDILYDNIVNPIIVSNLDTTGTFEMSQALFDSKTQIALHKFYQKEDLVEFFSTEYSKYSFYSLGITNLDLDKLEYVSSRVKLNKVCIDVANGYIDTLFDKIRYIKCIVPHAEIMCGNIATPDIIKDYALAGVNIIKVGIGSGGLCKTRTVTGIGLSQLYAILKCVPEAQKYSIDICSDGGCMTTGDICKAIAAGSKFVMLGSRFCGANECCGEWVVKDNDKYLKSYGMSSHEAMLKHYGEVANYRASEGDCKLIEAKGPASIIIEEILGGIRSACAYVGAKSIKELSKCATFIRVNRVK